MAKNNEIRLVSKIVRDREIAPVLERGVNEDWFGDPEAKMLFGFIRKHHTKYGEVPTATTVKDSYPTADLLKVEDSLDYLLDEMVAFHRHTTVTSMLAGATDHIEAGDSEAAIRLVESELERLRSEMSEGNVDVDLAATTKDRLAEYEARASSPGGITGIEIGYPSIDHETGGIHPGQLIVAIASPKTGKSTFMVNMAHNIHKGGHVPFLQSFEMSLREQTNRLDAIQAGINAKRLKFGRLTAAEKIRYEEMLRDLEGKHQFLLSEAASGLTLSALAGKVAKYDPDVVMVDGVYLMIDEITGESNTPQALTNISRGMKRLAQKTQKPFIISTQTLLWKMKGVKVNANSIGYSSSFFQDADVLLGLERPEDDTDDSYRTLRIVEGRDVGKVECDITWNWEISDFTEMAGL